MLSNSPCQRDLPACLTLFEREGRREVNQGRVLARVRKNTLAGFKEEHRCRIRAARRRADSADLVIVSPVAPDRVRVGAVIGRVREEKAVPIDVDAGPWCIRPRELCRSPFIALLRTRYERDGRRRRSRHR